MTGIGFLDPLVIEYGTVCSLRCNHHADYICAEGFQEPFTPLPWVVNLIFDILKKRSTTS